MQLNLNKKKLPSDENLRLIAQLCISLANKQDTLEGSCITPWESGKNYTKDVSYISYDGYLWICNTTNTDTNFDETHWIKLSDNFSELSKDDIAALINLTPEQILSLKALIDDESITTSTTYSSSKIYEAIQEAITECKDNTATQITNAFKEKTISLDDNNVSTETAWSSSKVNSVVESKSTEIKEYANTLLGTHLTKKIVDALPTEGEENILYLVRKSDDDGEYLDQYLYNPDYTSDDDKFVPVGSTKFSSGRIAFYEESKDYHINDIILYKPVTADHYFMYVCKEAYTSDTTFDETKWDIVNKDRKVYVISDTAPSDTNALWICTAGGKTTIKVYNNDQWISVSSNGTSEDMGDYITVDYATEYEPVGAYNPASKKYVDGLAAFNTEEW